MAEGPYRLLVSWVLLGGTVLEESSERAATAVAANRRE